MSTKTESASDLERRKSSAHPAAPRPRHRGAEIRGQDVFTSSRTPSACATTASRKTSTSCCSSSTASTRSTTPRRPTRSTTGPNGSSSKTWKPSPSSSSTAGLAQNESPRPASSSSSNRKKRRRSEWMQTLTNILYIKIPLFDPDRLLKAMLPLCRLDLLAVVLHPQRRRHASAPSCWWPRTSRRSASKLPDYHEFFQLQDRGLPVGGPGRGQGDPRVRPRPQLQGVRRRGPRDGPAVLVPLAGHVLQRLRRLDACRASGTASSSASPASTSS